jgi:hypothetical protein
MNEEALKVLKMIEEGKITADEGKKLLEALSSGEEEVKEKKTAAPDKKNKILRVIVDTKGQDVENARVRINIPLEVAKKFAGLTALIPKEAREEMLDKGVDIDAINLEELIGMFESGLIDENLVDVEAGNSGKGATVKVYVD